MDDLAVGPCTHASRVRHGDWNSRKYHKACWKAMQRKCFGPTNGGRRNLYALLHSSTLPTRLACVGCRLCLHLGAIDAFVPSHHLYKLAAKPLPKPLELDGRMIA